MVLLGGNVFIIVSKILLSILKTAQTNIFQQNILYFRWPQEGGMEGGRIPFPSKFLSVFPVPLAKIAFPLRKLASHYKFQRSNLKRVDIKWSLNFFASFFSRRPDLQSFYLPLGRAKRGGENFGTAVQILNVVTK